MRATELYENPQGAVSGERVIKVLLVDDERTLRDSCTSVLVHDGYQVRSCGRGLEAKALLHREKFDVVLLDMNMSQVSGMELLELCLEVHPESRAIMITGNPSVASSIEALEAGAWDYLAKPFTADHLKILLGRARHEILATGFRTAEDQPPLQEITEDAEEYTLLGRSPAFMRMIQLTRKVAATGASVFLTGESGSGKEMIAQFIHHNSRRKAKPMVAINCAALPENLLESEMFGHVKGAFTGATRDKAGLLEIADGGTLFLDELTEMPLQLQAKLLRVLQDGNVRRVGSESVNAKVNVRFITATNRDPLEAIKAGVLRADLYYRLGVVPVQVPPLRKRTEDIPQLAQYFLEKYWGLHREPGTPQPTLSQEAIDSLCSRTWRGNVRELQNVIEYAVVMLEPGALVHPADLPFIDDPARNGSPAYAADAHSTDWTDFEYHAARDQVLADFECAYVTAVVRRANSNLSKAAKIAGVDRTTLYRLMEKHGLQRTQRIQDPSH